MKKTILLMLIIGIVLSFATLASADIQEQGQVFISAIVGEAPTPTPPAGGGVIFDFTPPYILDIEIKNITRYSAEISWRTNEETISQVNFGTTPDYGKIIIKKDFRKNHLVRLTDLSSDTEYHFEIIAKDRAGNRTSSGDYSFRTLAPPIPPEPECQGADLDFDGDVDIADFSILLYFWHQTNPENKCVDINQDGIVGLVDFSIMMYQWTD